MDGRPRVIGQVDEDSGGESRGRSIETYDVERTRCLPVGDAIGHRVLSIRVLAVIRTLTVAHSAWGWHLRDWESPQSLL